MRIQGIMKNYENFQIKIGKSWYYITPENLNKKLKNVSIEGKKVKKRVRTWIE